MGARSRELFTGFVLSRWPGLFRLAYGLTADPDLAGEVALAAMASAYAAWAQLSRMDEPDAQLRRMLVRASTSALSGRRAAEGAEGAQPGAPSKAGPTGQAVPVMRALADLPQRQRAVLVLRYWEDLSDAQVAAALRCTRATVRGEASRALAALRLAGAFRTAGDT